MIDHQIIISPIVTEKSMKETALNRYTFKVKPNANKHQIKIAIQELFSVDVVKIRTSKTKPEMKKSLQTGKKKVIKGYKKAIVELKPKQKIDLFDTSDK